MLVLVRVLTGAFGGILGGMSLAIIGDVFPEHRRGRATGSLMTGFALASVAGVPLGLYIGTGYGWHVPFIALAIAGLPALILAPFALPALDAHVGKTQVHPLASLDRDIFTPQSLKCIRAGHCPDDRQLYGIPVLEPVFGGECRFDRTSTPVCIHRGWWADALRGAYHWALGRSLWKAFSLSVRCSWIGLVAAGNYSFAPGAGRCRRGSFRWADGVQCWPNDRGNGDGDEQRRTTATGALPECELFGAACCEWFRAYLGGVIVSQSADGKIEHFGTVGWIAAGSTLATLWLASRVRILVGEGVSAASISLAAAAEAEADAGAPILNSVELTSSDTEPSAKPLRGYLLLGRPVFRPGLFAPFATSASRAIASRFPRPRSATNVANCSLRGRDLLCSQL